MFNYFPSKKYPGLVIFMVNQSFFMQETCNTNGKRLAVIAADIINIVLTEMIRLATRPIGEDDEEVLDYQRVILIGYGNDPDEPAQILFNDFLSTIAENHPMEYTDTFLGRDLYCSLIKPVAGNIAPIIPAFELVKREINSWKETGHDSCQDHSPIVINITCDMPVYNNENFTDDLLGTQRLVRYIMTIPFCDGNPLILNMIIDSREQIELFLPDSAVVFERISPFAKFLLGIASNMTNDIREAYYYHYHESLSIQGIPNIDSKLFLKSSNPAILINQLFPIFQYKSDGDYIYWKH